MFSERIGRVENQQYREYYEYWLILLSALALFRPVATIALILFIFSNLLYCRRMSWDKRKWTMVLLIASPLLLDLLFLWNNDSVWDGVKNGEKHLSTFLLPWAILGQAFTIDVRRVLKGYTWLFTSLLTLGLIRYIFLFPEEISKYLAGIEVWKMGYHFALSLKLHAPALNMHIAFLLVTNFYLIVDNLRQKRSRNTQILQFVCFILSVILLLAVNTRMALLNAFLGIFLILVWELLRRQPRRKLLNQAAIVLVIFSVLGLMFVKTFPYVISKYTDVTFKHMDKIGRLDEIENPEAEVYNSLVTRVSIWKTAWEIGIRHPFTGVGAADARKTLVQEYANTGQEFLYRHEFPTHNQYLDFFLKFGVLGLLVVVFFVFGPVWTGFKTDVSLASFLGVLFFTSNLTDDFLVRFDGIVFYAFWFSVFMNRHLSWNSGRST
jgi:O-antigen ligase